MSKHLTPIQAIRKKCIRCSENHRKEIRHCLILDCPLYIYRMGTNPYRRGIGGYPSHKSVLESAEISKERVLNG